MTGFELHSKKNTAGKDTVELIQSTQTEGEACFVISLYRLTLKQDTFYLVSSEKNNAEHRESAAEAIGSDGAYAEEVYGKLVRGCVPPATLHEIITDLVESDRYSVLR